MSTDRELRAEVLIDAPVDKVWEVLTDLDRMPSWSDELVRMVPMRRGGLRAGQVYLGINRRKGIVWPSRNVVRRYEPGVAMSWLTTSSGAEWVYELAPEGEGTRIVHRRPVVRLTRIGRAFATVALGGGESHADELEVGMGRTLERLKAAVES